MHISFVIPHPMPVIVQRLKTKNIYDRYEYDYDPAKPYLIRLKRLNVSSLRDWYPTNWLKWALGIWEVVGDDCYRTYIMHFSKCASGIRMDTILPALSNYHRVIEFFEKKLDAVFIEDGG